MRHISDQEKSLKDYKFVDLFCGIGGFHLALSSYGAECVFASEINKDASITYAANFGMIPDGDIRDIEATMLPDHDILCAGFPCQAFSISGNRGGFNDPKGRLFFEIVRLLEHHKPKMLLLENVRNLKAHDDGKTYKRIIDELKNVGYTCYSDTLNSTFYGVPQARNRIYFVAFRDDLEVTSFRFPRPNLEFKVLSDIVIEPEDEKYALSREYSIDLELEEGFDRSSTLLRIGAIGSGRQGERIYSPKGQAVTLSAQGGGLGGKTGLYYINGTVRKLSGRECARLMGYPDSFKISKLDSINYRQFGNSVVVNVIQDIVRELTKQLLR